MSKQQSALSAKYADVCLKLTKSNIVSDNVDITRQSIAVNALIVKIVPVKLLCEVNTMADLIFSAVGLGICVAGIAFLILKGGGDG